MPGDRYAEYYAAKLWQMLPGIYRSLDGGSIDPGRRGPLREIVNRIGAEAAVVRRSIDRLWEDQSIESCDDWIIPYIGDLLGTRLVACLDARAKRLDVAKTIYYRRRAGTVGLLEELASDIAGRDARVVEFFRHLGRTRHCFDPPIGLVPRPSLNGELSLAAPIDPSPLALIEGLSGAYTRTPMGGYADLRHRYGASKAKTAIDEYFYSADFRRGRQSVGWHNIPKLGVFIWWLPTYLVPPATPVEYAQCPNQFTFDPTGREIPLFCSTRRAGEKFGEAWTSPDEWELPVQISQALFELRPDQLYADAQDVHAIAVLEGKTSPYALMGLNRVAVNVERGRFRLIGAPPADATVHARYHYGFGSDIGAGTYDQRIGGTAPPQLHAPFIVDGGNNLAAALEAFGSSGTLAIGDSLTYDLPGDLGAAGGIGEVVIAGKNRQRPVIRATGAGRPQWTITGAGETSTLLVQGIHLAGADLVLAGKFKSVQLRCVTLDPGTSGAALKNPAPFAPAADGRTLWPTRLFVEASIDEFVIDRAITGPVRTRNGGAVESLRVTDSIVQALPESLGPPLPSPLADPAIATSTGEVALARTTVLGAMAVHRLDASECILDDVAIAEDPQHGCIRFTAYAEGSAVHQPYESVTVTARAPLFRSRDFGRPDYAQLRESVDEAILTGRDGASIVGGAENGSEMGAFARERIQLKRRGLVQKFAEYMPVGLVPVWIDVT
jgi:hypothetical protein